MKSKLAKVFEEILREVDTNPDLRSRIEGVLIPDRSPRESPVPAQPARNRRARGALDPYEEFENGEVRLREKLSNLTGEQLKDIVSEYALDSSRLALKWKDRERLITLIVGTVRGRIEKGDAFRESTLPQRQVALQSGETILSRPRKTPMNLDQLKKNVNQRVQLRPIARRFDDEGNELEQIEDDWIMEEVSDDGVRIANVRTGHATTLGRDHIHHYTSNPDRSRVGVKYGFLTLNVQITMSGATLSIEPTNRPGQPTTNNALETLSRIERTRLLDERFEKARADYLQRGTPKPMIDTFSDLSAEEKAELFDRVIQWKKGHPSKDNPYR